MIQIFLNTFKSSKDLFFSVYNSTFDGKYVDLLDGTLESNCPKPCLQTKVPPRFDV